MIILLAISVFFGSQSPVRLCVTKESAQLAHALDRPEVLVETDSKCVDVWLRDKTAANVRQGTISQQDRQEVKDALILALGLVPPCLDRQQESRDGLNRWIPQVPMRCKIVGNFH